MPCILYIICVRREWLSGRASPCQGEGRGFESRFALSNSKRPVKGAFYLCLFFIFGAYMLKTVLAAINAKYIHSCLALYSLRAFCPQYSDSIYIREFNINQGRGFIMREIYADKPDIIGFSCYIWNIGIVTALVKELKKLLPNLIVILGGPEVSYDHAGCPADIIVRGEGEQAFRDIMAFYNDKTGYVTQIMGGGALEMDRLPFIYAYGAEAFENRIIYYESSRGCASRCKYCLSSAEGVNIRLLQPERVYKELKVFLDNHVRQVKFVDRTFNYLPGRAYDIWRFLKENDNGFTNFHFEIAADKLTDRDLRLLSDIRKGFFQFEIGVQTTNVSVLKEIKRESDLSKIKDNVAALRESGRIHLHLDLIAGLPGEGYSSFRQSFNDVYAMKPDTLQLGFLKLLKGTALRAEAGRYGLVYEDLPPYEVLKSDALTFDEICRLKDIEVILEGFFNAGLAPLTLRYLTCAGAFEFYERMAAFWRARGYNLTPRGKMAMYAALREYCLQTAGIDMSFALELMRFDLLARENEKNPPEWLVSKPTPEERRLYRVYKKQMGADAFSIQAFEYDISSWVFGTPVKRRNTLLFRYKNGKGKGIFYEITEGS